MFNGISFDDILDVFLGNLHLLQRCVEGQFDLWMLLAICNAICEVCPRGHSGIWSHSTPLFFLFYFFPFLDTFIVNTLRVCCMMVVNFRSCIWSKTKMRKYSSPRVSLVDLFEPFSFCLCFSFQRVSFSLVDS